MSNYLGKKAFFDNLTISADTVDGYSMDQGVLTTSSPTFAALTLSGLTASTLVYSNASKAFTSLANGSGYLLNDGSGGLSWGAVDTSPFWRIDGTSTPSAAWDLGDYGFTALNLTAAPTLSAEQLTNVAGWTPTTNWTYAGGKWSHATGNATALTATGETAIVVDTKYIITITNTTTTAGGGLIVSMGGQTFPAITASGTNTYNVRAVFTTALAFTPTGGTWVGSIDSISVKILSAGALTGTSATVGYGLTVQSGQLLFPDGEASYPGLGFTYHTNYGIRYYSGYVATVVSGANRFLVGGNATYCDSTYFVLNSSSELSMSTPAANILKFGKDSETPSDQTLMACGGSGTDKVGAMLTVNGGQSTGAGAPGGVRIQTSTIAGTGSTANTYYTRQFIDGKVHTVSNNSATAMFSIANADGNAVGGYINYTVEVTDGTDIQLESGTFTFAAVNKATETWTTDADKGTVSAVVSSGTLTVTWAVDTATADTVKVTVNSNSSLTPTSSKVQFQIFLNSPKVITIL
jgi:hypothetical protein